MTKLLAMPMFQIYQIDGRGRRESGRDVECDNLDMVCALATKTVNSSGKAEIWNETGLVANIAAYSPSDFEISFRPFASELAIGEVTRAICGKLVTRKLKQQNVEMRLQIGGRLEEMKARTNSLRSFVANSAEVLALRKEELARLKKRKLWPVNLTTFERDGQE